VREDSKTAVVAVEGGQLTKEEVKGQLQLLFPGKWVWDLRDHECNSFITKFPSKLELQSAMAFGGAMAKGDNIPGGVRLSFDLWQEKEIGFLLPKVWVRVFWPEEGTKGIPGALGGGDVAWLHPNCGYGRN
jgi:hypothetical protein